MIRTLSSHCWDGQSLKLFELSTLLGSESSTNHSQDIKQITMVTKDTLFIYHPRSRAAPAPLRSGWYMNGISGTTIVYLLLTVWFTSETPKDAWKSLAFSRNVATSCSQKLIHCITKMYGYRTSTVNFSLAWLSGSVCSGITIIAQIKRIKCSEL